MKSRSRLPAAISAAVLGGMLSACISSAAGPLSREALWAMGGHINTRWSMEDALTQGLSRKVTGEDLHSHQIMLRRKNGQTIYQQSALQTTWGSTVCASDQNSRDWAELKCRAIVAVKERPPDAICDDERGRCTIVQLAPFILREEGLLAAVASAAERPCDVIPDFRALQKRHRIREPQGALTMHRADVSQYWLYCDTSNPVRGRFLSTSIPDIFVVRWDRAFASEQATSSNWKEMEK